MNNTSRLGSLVTALALVFFLAGCGKRSAPESASAPSAIAPSSGEVGAAALPIAERPPIVMMDVSMTVERVDDVTARIRSAVEHAGGFVSDSQSSGTSDEQAAYLELRVPADKARSLRTALGELGEVTSATEKVEDVTEQRADIEARLVSARTQERRLLEIMAGKTTSIHELVEAEKELARVRENVERLEAQERVMKSRIQLATVRVRLSTRSVPAWQTPGPSIARAGKAGLRAAAAIAVSGGMAAAATGPTLLPIFALVAGVAIAVRRRRMKELASLAG